MKALRTIEQIRQDYQDQWSPPDRKRARILDPAAGECAPLFTSKLPDCLTHITRYIASYPDRTNARGEPWPAYDIATGWCGAIISCRQIELVDASGFVCAKCIERCEQLGLPIRAGAHR